MATRTLESARRFQPTRPLRGATAFFAALASEGGDFNPRAPCGARPDVIVKRYIRITDFNPRAPCGARHRPHKTEVRPTGFQPTRPLRGATPAD